MQSQSHIVFDELHQSIISECEHIRTLMQTEESDNVIETAFQKFLDTYSAFLSKEQSNYSDVYVTIYAFALILENHIRRKSVFDVIRGLEMLRELITDLKKSPFPEQQIKSIRDIGFPVIQKGLVFLYAFSHPKAPIQYARRPTQKCLLCKSNNASQTGSHLIPHFLIQRFFSFDGSSKREKEVVKSFSMMDGDTKTYLGKETSPEYIEELYGRELTDEEVIREGKKHSLLTRDYFFCPSCEKRFSVIEEQYAEIQKNPSKPYHPSIPYLFWLSVIWRMSVGRLAIHMLPEHEQRIRKVLDKTLSIDKSKIFENKSLGYFAYRLAKATELKNETPCIVGIHDSIIPYSAIIGDYVLCFYPSIHIAKKCARKTPFDIATINDGIHPEVITELSFLSYWYTKREIFRMIYAHPSDYEGASVQDLAKFQSQEDLRNFADFFGNEVSPFPLTSISLKDQNIFAIPASVVRILNSLKHNKTGEVNNSLQDIIEKTGYSQEEIEFMLNYAFSHWESVLGANPLKEDK